MTARELDRSVVEGAMLKSDGVLKEIVEIAKSWEGTEAFWSPTKWKIVEYIREALLKPGKRVWKELHE